MDFLDSAIPKDARDEIMKLRDAIALARQALEDGRRVGDALKILNKAWPKKVTKPDGF